MLIENWDQFDTETKRLNEKFSYEPGFVPDFISQVNRLNERSKKGPQFLSRIEVREFVKEVNESGTYKLWTRFTETNAICIQLFTAARKKEEFRIQK